MRKQQPKMTETESDDEAPDTVSFNQGREEALQSISDALQDLKRTKLKVKERRRERDRRLKEQKLKKVSLSKARLPEALLTELSKQQDATIETSLGQPRTEDSKKEADEEEEEDLELDSEEDWEDTTPQSNIQIIQTSKIVQPPPHEAALDFLKTQMYGCRIPRESTAKNLSRKLKKAGKPGVNFHRQKLKGIQKKK